MSLLPIFLKLEGRPVLVVGAGAVALDKIGSLLKVGARLRVVAPEARAEVRALASDSVIEWVQRGFEPADLDGHELVIAATDQADVNAAVYRNAGERGIFCNSVDDIPNCDFFFGSVVARGELQIAISTAGESPSLAQRLRREIDAQLPQDLGPWLEQIGELRREILATHPRTEERRLLLHELAHRPLCDSPTCSTRLMAKPAKAPSDQAAQVYLVGAGPGDPDLLTVRAVRLVQSAEVVLHDDLVPQAILDLAPNAEIVNVGKRCGVKRITQEEINALMIDYARGGRVVVRLKSGDPLIFGRAAEEMDALRDARIRFEVVPGITSALAAAASIPASLTDRHAASNVIFSTGHHAQSHNDAALPSIEDATRVVYMPGRDLTLLAEEWLTEGLPADFPCVLVSRAAQPDQQVWHTTLWHLGSAPAMQAPSLLLAGWAVGKLPASALKGTIEDALPA
ncbi:siroheme synthase CysG [Occallatibacter riparius]|uniref:Siroheme synthase CysG n=1 Tax=Occallatibacter riparius TaxID=1002689 RepID=A0A9J7BNY4_9BACT|nr:siroheme synthase CysG [Occallatibacter riparius]UWZ84233.1 siroheme synthase CysG [Occallatibacter riparius]